MRAKFSGRLVVKPSEIAVTPLDQVFMEKLLKAVEVHLEDRQFSVDALSKEVNMSTSQLNRKLKAIINQPASQFIRSVRLQRAMKMLQKEAGTISEIAFKTGFETPSYFTKMFKARFGCLPSEKEKFPENA
jgi:AraC-like DNA-binding protein